MSNKLTREDIVNILNRNVFLGSQKWISGVNNTFGIDLNAPVFSINLTTTIIEYNIAEPIAIAYLKKEMEMED